MSEEFRTLFSLLRPEDPIRSRASDARLKACAVRRIELDSRQCRPGDLFVALRGSRVDGHTFVPLLIERGIPVVVDRPIESNGALWIEVPDTAAYLGLLSDRLTGSPSSRTRVVGVTGTNGKTSVTRLIAELVPSGASMGTIGLRMGKRKIRPLNHTTPFAPEFHSALAAAVDAGASIVATEVSSHALVQKRVVGCRFEGAVFTNLTHDHLDDHASMEAYYRAKRTLFTTAQPNWAVINVDDPYGKRLASELSVPVIRVSLQPGRSVHFSVTKLAQSTDGTRATLVAPSGRYPLNTRLVGEHNVQNILCALGALHGLGIPIESALDRLASFPGVDGRLERVVGGDRPVFVDYAHTPDALQRVLKTLRSITRRRVWVVFGCGGDRDPHKRPIMGAIAAAGATGGIVTSDNPRTEEPASIVAQIVAGIPPARRAESPERLRDGGFAWELDRRTAIDWMLSVQEPGDTLLVAGKGHETVQIVGTESHPFDDREVIRNYTFLYR